MIVNETREGWEIIFQRNHALLAGAIAQEIKPSLRPPRWIETLSAIIEHDDGQTDWNEGSHITKEGYPLDFTQYEFDLDQAKRVVTIAKHKSQWITLLVSMHVCSLYESKKEEYPKLKKYLEELEEVQRSLRKTLGVNKSAAESYYEFLRWCDECSLILCQNRLSKQSALPVGRMFGESHNIKIVEGNSFTVDPWCFHQNSFSVCAEVYPIRKKKFCNTEELKQCLMNTIPLRKKRNFISPTGLQ